MGYSFLEPDRFWEEYLYKILANVQHSNLLPLTKDVTVCVKKYDLFTFGCFVLSLIEFGSEVLNMKLKM